MGGVAMNEAPPPPAGGSTLAPRDLETGDEDGTPRLVVPILRSPLRSFSEEEAEQELRARE